MFKLLPIIFALCFALAAAYPEAQLAVPEDNYTIVANSKSEQQSNAISSEDNSNEVEHRAEAAPASVTRLTQSGTGSGLRSQPLVIASSGGVSSSSSSGSSSSLPTIQHHILPAEAIALPITISTRPGLRTVIAPETITIHQPTIAKIGEVVQKIPTAVSHQSQTIVHKHARVVTPIVAPAVRTITSHVVRAYHTPLVYAPHAPIVQVLRN